MYSRKQFRSLFARRASVAAAILSAAVLAVPCSMLAQTPQAGSSSADYSTLLSTDPEGTGSAAPSPQYGRSQHQYDYHGYRSHIAVEGGGGFVAPVGNSQRDLTWGYNFLGGVGYKFSRNFSMMAEYQFDRNKIPGAVLTAVGEPGGNVHTWSLTLDPVLYYKTSGKVGGYIIGGGGFYRKLTSFTQPTLAYGEYCDYFSCYPYEVEENVVVSHYSSNQGGLNLGTGVTFGGWSGAKFFAEARYTWLDSPTRGTQFIPVTFGLRW